MHLQQILLPQTLLQFVAGEAKQAVLLLRAEPLEELHQLLVEIGQRPARPLRPANCCCAAWRIQPAAIVHCSAGGLFRPLSPRLRREPVAQIGQVARAHHPEGRGTEILPSLTHQVQHHPLPRLRLHLVKLLPPLFGQGVQESLLMFFRIMLHPVEQGLAILAVGLSRGRAGMLLADPARSAGLAPLPRA